MSNTARDTGFAKMPSIPRVNVSDPALSQWMRSVTEWIELRSGSLGNREERAVTLRELKDLAGGNNFFGGGGSSGSSGPSSGAGSGPSSTDVNRFIESIKASRLYKDLLKRLDDPTRFDHLAAEIRAVLLKDIAAEAASRGAAIQRMETIIQNETRSLAMTVEEVTASVDGSSSGVRELSAAFAESNHASAVHITQLKASLGNYYPDGSAGSATLEEVLDVSADKIKGLRSQYMLKVEAGGAISGFGLIASESADQLTNESKFIVMADQFAIVGSDPENPAFPFGVDATTGQTFINGSMIIQGAGAIEDLLPATYRDYRYRRSTSILTTSDVSQVNDPPGWLDAPPVYGAGSLFMITAQKMVQSDNLKGSWSAPVMMNGYSGASTKFQYLVNTSSTDAPTGEGSATPLSVPSGSFLWMRTGVTVPPSTETTWSGYVRVSGEKGDKGDASTVPGVAGVRAPVVIKRQYSAWESLNPTVEVAAMVGSVPGSSPLTPVHGDIIWHYGGAKEFNGTSWVNAAAYIVGSMIVDGTVAASAISAGTLNADAVTLNSNSGTVKFGTGSSSGYTVLEVDANSPSSWSISADGAVYADGVILRDGDVSAGSMSIKLVPVKTWGLTKGSYHVDLQSDGNLVLYNGSTATWSALYGLVSDRRRKTEIHPTVSTGLDVVKQLEVVDFRWVAGDTLEDGAIHTGFISQDVQKVVPSAVGMAGGTLMLDKTELIPYAIKAIQELSDEVLSLRSLVNELRKTH